MSSPAEPVETQGGIPDIDELLRYLANDQVKCNNCEAVGDWVSSPCPFGQEVQGDDTRCRCCDECERECALDI